MANRVAARIVVRSSVDCVICGHGGMSGSLDMLGVRRLLSDLKCFCAEPLKVWSLCSLGACWRIRVFPKGLVVLSFSTTCPICWRAQNKGAKTVRLCVTQLHKHLKSRARLPLVEHNPEQSRHCYPDSHSDIATSPFAMTPLALRQGMRSAHTCVRLRAAGRRQRQEYRAAAWEFHDEKLLF